MNVSHALILAHAFLDTVFKYPTSSVGSLPLALHSPQCYYLNVLLYIPLLQVLYSMHVIGTGLLNFFNTGHRTSPCQGKALFFNSQVFYMYVIKVILKSIHLPMDVVVVE